MFKLTISENENNMGIIVDVPAKNYNILIQDQQGNKYRLQISDESGDFIKIPAIGTIQILQLFLLVKIK